MEIKAATPRNSIMQMARGAFEERVDYEMDKVIQNILDPNTKPTAKRNIAEYFNTNLADLIEAGKVVVMQ